MRSVHPYRNTHVSKYGEYKQTDTALHRLPETWRLTSVMHNQLRDYWTECWERRDETLVVPEGKVGLFNCRIGHNKKKYNKTLQSKYPVKKNEKVKWNKIFLMQDVQKVSAVSKVNRNKQKQSNTNAFLKNNFNTDINAHIWMCLIPDK